MLVTGSHSNRKPIPILQKQLPDFKSKNYAILKRKEEIKMKALSLLKTARLIQRVGEALCGLRRASRQWPPKGRAPERQSVFRKGGEEGRQERSCGWDSGTSFGTQC